MLNNLLPDKYGRYVSLGVEIAVSMALPVVGGYLLDDYFGTSPWLVLTGIVLGMLNFGLMIARIAKKLNEEDDK
ncbi:AtpZ/AtpI family protein [Gracilimonas mengyeensis]|uniref:F0F1-ATPase subunit Ca2+/Mg2+ transporter n=1 Tax=Gracilimonas mengyeensis TaxID=1302730 RepID=A0A521AB94_9BACT|nr:AtpZ/AtpI family protein [Gracilimonas mengyeensis]SMO32052.1 Putative F0F1-ATPase subunit Ca2+/Mg2+ transporter [Gracilimonas mengyeensis]